MSCDEAQIHKNNVGVRFNITILDQDDVAVPLQTATIMEITFLKPDRSRLVKTATLYTDGSDGIISYITIEGDLDVAGAWRGQAYVEVGSQKLYTNTFTFKVYENI